MLRHYDCPKKVVPHRRPFPRSPCHSRRVERLLAILAAVFAALAVALASLGLYGVVSFATSARAREIGVRQLKPLLYDLEPFDEPTLVAVVLIVTAVTTAAALLPARRAARINPVETLR